MKNLTLYILFLHIALIHGNAQNFNLSGRVHSGAVYPHHQSINYVVEDYIQGVELNLSKTAYGKHYWEQLYYHPEYGVAYFSSNLGNNTVFGHLHALFAYMDIPLVKPGKKFTWNYHLAFGAAYLTKKFDLETNYFNTAIGSHLNVFARVGSGVDYQITDKVKITALFSAFHASSGKISAPNQGLNILTGALGVNYSIQSRDIPEKDFKAPPITKRWNYSIVYGGGIKKPSDYTLNHYYISSLGFTVQRVISLKRKLGIGVDVFYDPSVKEIIIEKEEDWQSSYSYQTGFHISHELVYNRISWPFHIGYYLVKSPEKITPVYFRTGLKYQVFQQITASFLIKAHYFVADYIEWGLAYTF